MKGPYERLKYDLKRIWECRLCKHRERTDGWVTHQYCRCQQDEPIEKQTPMKLMKDDIERADAGNSA